ncbi:ASCH domain-containing protein [Pseudalkalibacillus decolorationis]|uniref:ASCH domain-containing protein n=1 Tax=Pseudalkalibacillus decolorationis TaxID=163879 RepID=UPI002147CF1F|nr:ASCH domain-containing protein [Pseudalkalibacillus decolorationis]
MSNTLGLPAKTCEIDRLITNSKDIEKVLAGKKTATRRNGRYADPGGRMVLKGHSFIVERVYEQTLGELTETMALQEGYVSVEEYKNSILSSHPGMRWLPQMKIWVHEFSPEEETTE